MKSPALSSRIAWPLALGGALVVLAICLWLLNIPLWISGLVAILVFVALYLILDPRSEKEVQVDTYSVEAQARARKTADTIRAVAAAGSSLPLGAVGTQVQNISHLAQELLDTIQQKRPNELQSSAEAIDYRMGKLNETLQVYGNIVRDPRRANQPQNAAISDRIETKTLPAVEQWLNNNLNRLSAGQMLQLEVNLDQLEASQYDSLK